MSLVSSLVVSMVFIQLQYFFYYFSSCAFCGFCGFSCINWNGKPCYETMKTLALKKTAEGTTEERKLFFTEIIYFHIIQIVYKQKAFYIE